MNENEKVTVEMTVEEAEALKAFRAEQERKMAAAKKAMEIENYKNLVDSVIEETVSKAIGLSEMMVAAKGDILDSFRAVIDLKEELFKGTNKLKDGRFSDTFTNSNSTKRVTIGYNTLDNYDDTYTAGVDMVNKYIESLASDDKSKQLADMVNTLLKERSKGNQLKAQNVLRLEKMATDSGDETFIEGMRIIRDAYRPIQSKQFVKVEIKTAESNEWIPVSLNMTNC